MSIQYTVSSIQCPVYSVLYTVYSVQYTVLEFELTFGTWVSSHPLDQGSLTSLSDSAKNQDIFYM